MLINDNSVTTRYLTICYMKLTFAFHIVILSAPDPYLRRPRAVFAPYR